MTSSSSSSSESSESAPAAFDASATATVAFASGASRSGLAFLIGALANIAATAFFPAAAFAFGPPGGFGAAAAVRGLSFAAGVADDAGSVLGAGLNPANGFFAGAGAGSSVSAASAVFFFAAAAAAAGAGGAAGAGLFGGAGRLSLPFVASRFAEAHVTALVRLSRRALGVSGAASNMASVWRVVSASMSAAESDASSALRTA